MTAFQFLTIIPLRSAPQAAIPADERDIGRSSGFFPVVGLFKGALLATACMVFVRGFENEAVAALLLVVSVLLNGGFHLDGLADTFDALASRKAMVRKLEIMKESTTGPAGTTAIVLLLILKFTLLLKIISLKAVPVIVLFPVFGAWSMVVAMFHGESARKEGLGRVFLDNTGGLELVLSTVIAAVTVYLSYIIGQSLPEGGYALPGSMRLLEVAWLFMPLTYLFSLTMTRLFSRHFGGLTGDNLGAISELSETVFLAMAALTFDLL
jgi:adenosylcobinamide-GDP ribazoletransferase